MKTNNNKNARRAGLLYLLYILLTFFSTMFTSKIVTSGDAASIASQILASEWRLRLGFMSELMAGVVFLLAAWALYVLLKPVNRNLAILFVLLNLGGVAVQSINALNLYAPVLILSGAGYLNALPAGQLVALSALFLDLHDNGFMIAQLFFAAWLFPLGFLVFKCGYVPRILGIVLMVECFAWLMYPLQYFLFPSTVIATVSSAVGFIGEFSLTLWLLIMGARDTKSALVDSAPRNPSLITETEQ
jgi:hypothetical protein